jgi:hypothetical protein
MVVTSGVVVCLRSIVNGCTRQESESQYFLLGLIGRSLGFLFSVGSEVVVRLSLNVY